ncbi:hypothetical protein PAGU2638_19130 [Lysobacter sp. PAGU 2638]
MHLELRPSRALSIALMALGVVGAAGMFLTDLPTWTALIASPVCFAWGLALARKERRRVSQRLVLRADGTAWLDDVAIEALQVDWQGPIAALAWTRDGRRERAVAWPDVLGAASRRELRLWLLTRPSRAGTAAVAP